jgi:hypothetical protein
VQLAHFRTAADRTSSSSRRPRRRARASEALRPAPVQQATLPAPVRASRTRSPARCAASSLRCRARLAGAD